MSFLDREHSVAEPGYSRWLVPTAALAIHLCIGQIYAYSVFKTPMGQLIGVSESAPGDWSQTSLSLIFTIALAVLGASAAIFGKWLERVGPRMAMFVSACCFAGGFLVAALGVAWHQLWLVYLGNGFIGGIGLGLGYISPVSTLIKWFPDRPGMATGMAIMGFGGGAMIASPLSLLLMERFATPTSVGVAPTFVTLAVIYFVVMMFGVFTVRVPPEGWQPVGYTPPQTAKRLVTAAQVDADTAIRTPQFWLLFVVLCFNVTAGIGILELAAVMIQDMFSVATVGEASAVTAAAAAGYVGLLSLFNMAGRFFWSSVSDIIGRKSTYMIFFALGTLLYILIPRVSQAGSVALFVLITCVILTMYGGGFATIPAYLRDLFGTMQVGAIHGRLLLAWSLAAILGPQIVNRLRDAQLAAGVPEARAYDLTMYIMAGLLVIGFICNLLVRPVDAKYHDQSDANAVKNPDRKLEATPASSR